MACVQVSLLALLITITFCSENNQTPRTKHGPIPEGFPAKWMGDRFYQQPCETEGEWPEWLDGFFFCQSSGSYGNQSDPDNERLTHMFAGFGALALFDLNPVQNKFSAHYYPTRMFKIWDFYDRDLTKSKIAWDESFGASDPEAVRRWKNISAGHPTSIPDVDFWKVGHKIIAGTEYYKACYMNFGPIVMSGEQNVR